MPKSTGLLREDGDRWKLDVLIPNRDRLLVGPQIPRTTPLHSATTPVCNTVVGIDPTLRYHSPVYSHAETMMEKQRRMRCGDIALPGDRLL